MTSAAAVAAKVRELLSVRHEPGCPKTVKGPGARFTCTCYPPELELTALEIGRTEGGLGRLVWVLAVQQGNKVTTMEVPVEPGDPAGKLVARIVKVITWASENPDARGVLREPEASAAASSEEPRPPSGGPLKSDELTAIAARAAADEVEGPPFHVAGRPPSGAAIEELDKLDEIARSVVDERPRSYVEAARLLARGWLALRGKIM